jgi:hypothetical protein
MQLDELVVKLSLDPDKFNQGTKEGQNLLRAFRAEVKRAADAVERDASKMADSFSRITKELLGLGLALAGANSLKNLVVGTVQAANAFNVASRALDVNEEALNRWTNAALRAGAKGDILGTLKGAVTTLGGVTTGLIPPTQAGQQALATLGISSPAWNDPEKFFKAVVQGFQTRTEKWPGQFQALAQTIPFGPELLQISKTYTTMSKVEEALRDSLTLTHEQAATARDTLQKVEEVRQAIEKQTNKLIPLVAPTVNEGLATIKSGVEGDIAGAAGHAQNTPLAWPFLPMMKLLQGEIAAGKMAYDWFNKQPDFKDRFFFGAETGEGDTYYGMPMPRPRPRIPSSGSVPDRYPGLGSAPWSKAWPSTGNGPVDMSRTFQFQNVTLMVPPGEPNARGFGDSFLNYISAVEAQRTLR